ncbi:hypothetical protein, partial [Ensifer soli]|uniref:hypothetical protein n=1 Tax=Ciceribacter sp. sgz301302 TaxID=3342379 RepID=UPI0035BB76AF
SRNFRASSSVASSAAALVGERVIVLPIPNRQHHPSKKFQKSLKSLIMLDKFKLGGNFTA